MIYLDTESNRCLPGVPALGIVQVPRSYAYVVAWLVDLIPHVDAYKYKGHTHRIARSYGDVYYVVAGVLWERVILYVCISYTTH